MPYLTRATFAMPPRNLGELLLRDIASLLTTSQLVGRSLEALRPQCAFSRELSATVDALLATSHAGGELLRPPLAGSDVELPAIPDAGESSLLTDFFIRLPARVAPGALAADVTGSLRLLAQHIELKARLAAEEALFVGQETLSHALLGWAAEWRSCRNALQRMTGRFRAGDDALAT
jgi:hypothetical protein